MTVVGTYEGEKDKIPRFDGFIHGVKRFRDKRYYNLLSLIVLGFDKDRTLKYGLFTQKNFGHEGSI